MAVDGDLGPGTLAQLSKVAIEGFAKALTPRTLCLTSPQQQGPDVGKLQLALGVKADWVFGAGTDAAVKSWQLGQGLISDGRIGDTCRSRLDQVA